MKTKPDKAIVDDAIYRLSLILKSANQGIINIFFCDESGFSLNPYIPYRYQKKGTQTAIPSAKTKVANILGFLNPFSNQLITYQLDDGVNMNSEIFIGYINDFIKKIHGPTVIVLDRASWHTSKLTKSMFSEWESKGLFIFLLPPRCPHLNLIETLWREMKYEWFCIADYRSIKTLQKKINHIFKNYGEDYCIKFSMNIFNL